MIAPSSTSKTSLSSESDPEGTHATVPLSRVAHLAEVGEARDPIPTAADSGDVSRDLGPRLSAVIPSGDDECYEAEWIDADELASGDFVVETAADLIRDGQWALLREDLVVAHELFERALTFDAEDPLATSAVAYCRFMLEPRSGMTLVSIDQLELRLEGDSEDSWLRFLAVRMCLRAGRSDAARAHLTVLREHVTDERLASKVDELTQAPGLSASESRSPAAPALGSPRLASSARRRTPALVQESFFEQPLGAAVMVVVVTVILVVVGRFNSASSSPVLFLTRGVVLAVFGGVLMATVFRARVAAMFNASVGPLAMIGSLVVGWGVSWVLPPAARPEASPLGLAAAYLFQVIAVQVFFRLYVDQALLGKVPTRMGVVVVSASLFGLLAVHEPQVLQAASWAEGLSHVGVMALCGGVPFAWLHVATRSVVPPFLCHLTAQFAVAFGS